MIRLYCCCFSIEKPIFVTHCYLFCFRFWFVSRFGFSILARTSPLSRRRRLHLHYWDLLTWFCLQSKGARRLMSWFSRFSGCLVSGVLRSSVLRVFLWSDLLILSFSLKQKFSRWTFVLRPVDQSFCGAKSPGRFLLACTVFFPRSSKLVQALVASFLCVVAAFSLYCAR
jgi:hypothetical protein